MNEQLTNNPAFIDDLPIILMFQAADSNNLPLAEEWFDVVREHDKQILWFALDALYPNHKTLPTERLQSFLWSHGLVKRWYERSHN